MSIRLDVFMPTCRGIAHIVHFHLDFCVLAQVFLSNTNDIQTYLLDRTLIILSFYHSEPELT